MIPKSTFTKFITGICLVGWIVLWILPTHADIQNIIINGNFDLVEDGKAAAWSFSSAKPEIFKMTFPHEKGQGNVAAMDASSAEMSGYLGQTITVKPNTNYRLSVLAKMNKGSLLIFIHGGANKTKLDTRIYMNTLENNPLVPWFWDPKWVQGSSGFPNRELGLVRNFLAEPEKWQPVSIDFNSGELDSVTVSLGAYFKEGHYQFDNVSVTEISN